MQKLQEIRQKSKNKENELSYKPPEEVKETSYGDKQSKLSAVYLSQVSPKHDESEENEIDKRINSLQDLIKMQLK